jgi:serine/threonine protein kinase
MQLLCTIATKKINFSKIEKASPELQNFLKRLLNHNPSTRLGGGETDSEELKNHPFFRGVDWSALYYKRITPPFVPQVADEHDISNIDKCFLNERPVDSPVLYKLTSSQKDRTYFEQFTYTRDQEYLLTTQD